MRNLVIVGLMLITACACKRPGAGQPPSASPMVTPSPSATPPPLAVVDAGPPVVDPVALRATCCQQCLAGASTDPAGFDISVSPCTRYLGQTRNEGPVLDTACGEFFSDNPELSIGECRGDPVE